MADRSRGLLRKVSCGSGTPSVLITELQANGNGGHVTRPPPQSELQKRNTLSVLIIELQANGHGGHVTRPPPHCRSGYKIKLVWVQRILDVSTSDTSAMISFCFSVVSQKRHPMERRPPYLRLSDHQKDPQKSGAGNLALTIINSHRIFQTGPGVLLLYALRIQCEVACPAWWLEGPVD